MVIETVVTKRICKHGALLRWISVKTPTRRSPARFPCENTNKKAASKRGFYGTFLAPEVSRLFGSWGCSWRFCSWRLAHRSAGGWLAWRGSNWRGHTGLRVVDPDHCRGDVHGGSIPDHGAIRPGAGSVNE